MAVDATTAGSGRESEDDTLAGCAYIDKHFLRLYTQKTSAFHRYA